MPETTIELPEGYSLNERLDGDTTIMTPEGDELTLAEYLEKNRQMPIQHEPASVPAEQTAEPNWMDSDPEQTKLRLHTRSENRGLLLAWIKSNLVEGVDYGVIKRRKSMWKPGAEKVIGMLGLETDWPDLDVEMNRLRGGSDVIYLTCYLVQGGIIRAKGAGARRLSEDGGDPNKAIKMCKKSSMIDAVLNVGGLSAVFTQDIDQQAEDESQGYDVVVLTEEQRSDLLALAKGHFGDKAEEVLGALARMRFQFGHDDWRQIPSHRFEDACRSIREKAEGSPGGDS